MGLLRLHKKSRVISFLGVIPARSGSKRLPGKNTKIICGKPLIAWSIEEALKSKYLSEICINTDDQKIIQLAQKKYPLNIPFVRPQVLCGDETKMVEVMEHMINFYDQKNIKIENIVLLQPTSPLRTADDIDQAIALFKKNKAHSVVGIAKAETPLEWYGKLGSKNSMKNFLNKKVVGKRSQDLGNYYKINGCIYIVNTNTFLKEKTFFTKDKTYGYVMPKEKSIDIDDSFDFIVAEALLKNSKK